MSSSSSWMHNSGVVFKFSCGRTTRAKSSCNAVVSHYLSHFEQSGLQPAARYEMLGRLKARTFPSYVLCVATGKAIDFGVVVAESFTVAGRWKEHCGWLLWLRILLSMRQKIEWYVEWPSLATDAQMHVVELSHAWKRRQAFVVKVFCHSLWIWVPNEM